MRRLGTGCLMISLTAVLASGMGAVNASGRGSPPPPPRVVDVEHEDFPRAVVDLCERFQRPEGRGADKPNGWASLLDVLRLMDAADEKAWRANGGAPPDFTRVYDGDAADAEAEAAKASAMKVIEELERSGVDGPLDEVRVRVRAARAKFGTPERVEEEKAGGVKDVPPFNGRLLEVLIPELGRVRSIARMNAARMHIAAEKGDWEKFAAVFEQNLAVARAVSHQATLIDRLVAIAVVSMTMNHARMHIMERRPPEAALVALAAAMDRQLVWPSMSLPIEGERLTALDVCRWAFSGKGADGKVDSSRVAEIQSLTGSEPELSGTKDFASRAETVALMEEFYAGAAKEASLPRMSRAGGGFDSGKFIAERVTGRYVVAQLTLPAVNKAMSANDQSQLEIAGTRAVLAVERFERANRKYPKTLEEAAAFGEVMALVDPWSPEGAVVRYRLLDSPEAGGRAYLVYSVGNDGRDDAGNTAGLKSRWDAINKKDATGVDFVVNALRE